MAGYTYSGARKQSRLAAISVLVMTTIGMAGIAFVIGALTGLDPGTGLRLAVLLGLPMLMLVAWVAPKSKTDPAVLLNRLLRLLLVAALLWPPYAIFSLPGIPSMEPKRAMLLLLLLVWAYKLLTAPVLGQRLAARLRLGGFPFLLLALFLFWRLASAVGSDQPVFAMIQTGWNLINYYLVFFVVLSCVRDMHDVSALLKVLLFCTLIITVLAILERVVGHNLFAKLIPANAEYAAVQAAALEDKLREGGSRVQSTFVHPMVLAEFLALVLPVLAFMALRSITARLRLLALSGLGLGLIAILLSGTRSAILAGGAAMALSMTLYFLNNIQEGRMSFKTFASVLGIVALVMGLLASLSVMAELIQGRSSGERGSSTARLMQIQAAQPKIEKRPLLGYGTGIGNSELGFKVAPGRQSVDNYYLSLTLDSGLPAAALFSASLLGFVLMGARLFLRGTAHSEQILAGFVAISLAALLAIQAVLSYDHNLLHVSLLCAILIILKEQVGAAARGSQP